MKHLTTELKIMLKNYHRMIESLEPHEESLLEDNLRQLKRCMYTGTQRLPWTSTNHEKFITVTSQVRKRKVELVEKRPKYLGVDKDQTILHFSLYLILLCIRS